MDRIIEKKKGLRKKHIPYVLLGLFVLVLLLWAIFGNHASTIKVDAEQLTISPVTKGEFKDYVRLSGTVVPIQVVQISPEEGGIVMEKVAEEGQSVKNNGKIGNYSEKRNFLASPNYRFFLRNYRMKKLSFLFFRSFQFFPLFLLNPLNP